MKFLQKLFYGRNGPDVLGMAVLVFGSVISFFPYGEFGTLITLAYTVFRMFSRNVEARRRENIAFVSFFINIKNYFKGFSKNNDPTHKTYCCSRCLQQLRVPVGKGKIAITCSRCGNKFIRQT